MKKFSIIFLSLLLLFCLYTSVSAYEYGDGSRSALINDLADVIDEEDEEILNTKLEQISESYECEVAILTADSTNGMDITVFADDFYDYNGFGYGYNDDGIMLVVDMGMRECALTTHGTAIDIFTDYNLSQLEAAFIPYMADDDFTNAFIAYYEECINIFDDYNTYLNDYDGEGNVYIPSDDGYGYNDDGVMGEDYYEEPAASKLSEIFSLQWIIVALIIGIAVGFFYTLYLKSQLKTVSFKPTATDYVIPGSFTLTGHRDVFLYRNVKKTPKPKENTSAGGRGSSFGSGSSTHTSSSGRTHGGSRGSF